MKVLDFPLKLSLNLFKPVLIKPSLFKLGLVKPSLNQVSAYHLKTSFSKTRFNLKPGLFLGDLLPFLCIRPIVKMASNQTAMDALINEMVRDVEYHERYKALKTLIYHARERQDIQEYKRLYKELTGQDIEIYTVPSKDRLIPRDHDKNKDAEFWFE